MFKIKNTPLRVKAAGPDDNLDEGVFEAYASVFGNTDSYGDIVEPGAFKRTLDEWASKGETIPVLWGHDMHDPFANIGGVLAAEEDEHGLKVTGQLDLDNPTAAQVYRLMKGRRTNRMSFAYSVRDSEKRDDGNHLKDLDLFEVSVVQVPANDLAEVLTVKSAADALVKAGRVLSQKNETALREARDSIDSVLKSLERDDEDEAARSGGDDQKKASGNPEAKPDANDEDPAGGKSSASREEPKAAPSVDLLAAQATIYALSGGQEGVRL